MDNFVGDVDVQDVCDEVGDVILFTEGKQNTWRRCLGEVRQQF